MAGFEKVKLLNGTDRQDYIKMRLGDGATVAMIHAEINSAALYSGPEGKKWLPSVVYAAKAKLAPSSAKATEGKPSEAPLREGGATDIVPDAFEGILTSEDMAEIKLEAAKNVRSQLRKKARASALAQATADLQREAALAAQRGQARGDMVDVQIDLAPYAPGITIDGVYYHHGTAPRVRRDVAKVIQETCSRSWLHQDSISGQKNDFNRQRSIRIGGGATSAPFVQGAEGLRA